MASTIAKQSQEVALVYLGEVDKRKRDYSFVPDWDKAERVTFHPCMDKNFPPVAIVPSYIAARLLQMHPDCIDQATQEQIDAYQGAGMGFTKEQSRALQKAHAKKLEEQQPANNYELLTMEEQRELAASLGKEAPRSADASMVSQLINSALSGEETPPPTKEPEKELFRPLPTDRLPTLSEINGASDHDVINFLRRQGLKPPEGQDRVFYYNLSKEYLKGLENKASAAKKK